MTGGRPDQGGVYSGRRVVRRSSRSLASPPTILSKTSSDTLSIQCKSSNTQDHGREPAAPLQPLLQKFACAQADQNTVEAGQRPGRDFQAEEIEQQAEVARRVEPERSQPLLEFSRHVVFRFAGADPKRAAHQLDERQEGCLLAVGRAASRQDEAPSAPMRRRNSWSRRDFHAGSAARSTTRSSRAGLVEPALQNLQFAFAPDESAQSPAQRRFEPRAP